MRDSGFFGFVASSNPVPRGGAWPCRAAYLFVVLAFLGVFAQFYIPGEGFTYLVSFGDKHLEKYLPELRATNFHLEHDSYGYDAQYYAQIAMHPRFDATLRQAVDNLPYRGRRILFCVTAYALGLFDPLRALQAYALQNLFGWLLLAAVLLRWFPANSWQNFFRWAATLFTFGLAFSVRGSLVDGPSLALIAVGMALLEAGRPWWSAVVLGLAGLGKETNILAGAAHAPADLRDVRGWRRALGRLVVIAAPLAGWLVWLHFRLGTAGDAGARNFLWPFGGYLHKWQEVLPQVLHHRYQFAGALVMVALTAQWLFFACRPRWGDPWWRLGASYAALMVVLGDAVWEGYPGAAARVLLPMTLAFNVAVPRTKRWLVVLILGNLVVLPSNDILKSPPIEAREITGPRMLVVDPATDARVEANFSDDAWYRAERSYFDYWQWARGTASITIHNPHPFALTADISFQLKSRDGRELVVRVGDRERWRGPTDAEPQVNLRSVTLAPGDTPLTFETDRPGAPASASDTRLLAFRICQFCVKVTGRN